MSNMGMDFKAPKQNDGAQWEKVRILFENGFAFHSCGCGGPGLRPARLRDVPQFLYENTTRTEGQVLLEKFASRKRPPRLHRRTKRR
jgi:hypothetical protein